MVQVEAKVEPEQGEYSLGIGLNLSLLLEAQP